MIEERSVDNYVISRLEAMKNNKSKDEQVLSNYSPEEKKIVLNRKNKLSSIVYFIGKDFEMPVELNQPGAGWHWNFKENKVKVDPEDLLNKPEDFCRFVMGHEAGHRRISRTGFIPVDLWKKPGFAFFMNSIEDPRDNNFVSEGYPNFVDDMSAGYEWIEEMEKQLGDKAKEKLGYQPRFKQAGFEYIRQWWREINKQNEEINQELPSEVQEVIESTLGHARESWWTFPTKQEADQSEKNIEKYAYVSFLINRDKIWPEFEKLVQMDLEDQKMQEFMKDVQGEKMESDGGDGGLPQEMKDQLSPEEQQELEKAIEKSLEDAKKPSKKEEDSKENKNDDHNEQEATEELNQDSMKGEGDKSESETNQVDQKEDGESGEGNQEEKDNKEDSSEEENGSGKPKPIDLDSLSDGLKQKIKDFLDSLPYDKKKELTEKASKELGDFSQELAKDLQGEMTENPIEKETREKEEQGEDVGKSKEKKDDVLQPKLVQSPAKKKADPTVKKFQELAETELKKDANVYETYRREVLPIINKLENDLRDIFIKRRAGQWKSGFKYGKRIAIKKRIQEKAKGVSAVDSKAWQKREAPGEKDYAITILNDLSGSMSGEKIDMDFKAKIVLAEVLNKLSIKCEILGFNDRIYEYQKFEQPMSNDIREKIGGMLQEVENFEGGRARYNDDGWALSEASSRLEKIRAKQKFIIVLSDGYPEESSQHSGKEYDLKQVVVDISTNTHQKLIGLGLLTDSVSNYYPNYIENVELEEMIGKLADLIRDIVVNYEWY